LGTTVTAVTVNAGMFQVIKIRCRQSIKVNNDKLSGFTAKPMLMSSNKLLKRKRKISFAIFYRQTSFISSCSSSRSRLCIKCGWTTSQLSFSSRKNGVLEQGIQHYRNETEVKVLGLAKLIQDFQTPSTPEESFNPTIGDNDFGVK
jgi:electron transfer flavoprotein alpha subunit